MEKFNIESLCDEFNNLSIEGINIDSLCTNLNNMTLKDREIYMTYLKDFFTKLINKQKCFTPVNFDILPNIK